MEQELSAFSGVMSTTIAGLNVSTLGTLALIVIMFTMGLTLRPANFVNLAETKKSVGFGLVAQLAILPVVAFALVWIFQPPLYVAAGLILLACCPGGATSNLFTHFAKGDVALSITLTVISGFVVVVSLPLLVNFGLETFASGGEEIRLPLVRTMIQIFILILLPVALGMTVLRFFPTVAARIEKVLTRVAFAVLLLTMGVLLHHVWDEMARLISETWLITVLLNVIMMGVGFLGARWLGVNEARSRCISIETGVQNYVLSMVIALSILERPDFVAVPITYLFTMYITVFSFIWYCRRRGPESDGSAV